jgi:hypothetical protein
MEAPGDMLVDHRNCNRADNRKRNLRLCKDAQNVRNRRKSRNKTSQYKGVSRKALRANKPWEATITVDGTAIHLGRFVHEHEAAVAYNAAATQYFGEFARLNVIGAQPA